MGVEYAHWFFVEDLNRIGDGETVRRVHDVLLDWELVQGAPKISSLEGGKAKRLKGSVHNLSTPPENLMVEYPTCEGATVAEIMGPSYYPPEKISTRYFWKITLITGADIRTYVGGETVYVQINQPPVHDGNPVEPYPPNFDLFFWSDAFPADETTQLPKVQLTVEDKNWKVPSKFSGIWRSGLQLDCSKDLPAIVEKSNRIPLKRFTKELENAFGTKLVQIGYVY